MTIDAVFDAGGLSAWATRRPPAHLLELLEVVARAGGAAVVPTAAVVEASTGRGDRDALVNLRLKRSVPDVCPLDRARHAALLRFTAERDVSAVDAIVVATAEARAESVVVTSDQKDIAALVAVASGRTKMLTV